MGTTTLARQVVELPLSADRNVNNLIATGPNVSRVTGQGTYAANGQRSRNNNYMIDGSDNNDISVTISTTQIVPESVAEFQVQTNAYSVEFGRNSGAQVNVITKSGSNRFRGDVWDYFRTNSLASLTNLEKANNLTSRPTTRATRRGEPRRADHQGQDVLLPALPVRRRRSRGQPGHHGSHPDPGGLRGPRAACRCAPDSRPRAARPCSTGSRS